MKAVVERVPAVWEAVLEKCCGLDVHKVRKYVNKLKLFTKQGGERNCVADDCTTARLLPTIYLNHGKNSL